MGLYKYFQNTKITKIIYLMEVVKLDTCQRYRLKHQDRFAQLVRTHKAQLQKTKVQLIQQWVSKCAIQSGMTSMLQKTHQLNNVQTNWPRYKQVLKLRLLITELVYQVMDRLGIHYISTAFLQTLQLEKGAQSSAAKHMMEHALL